VEPSCRGASCHTNWFFDKHPAGVNLHHFIAQHVQILQALARLELSHLVPNFVGLTVPGLAVSLPVRRCEPNRPTNLSSERRLEIRFHLGSERDDSCARFVQVSMQLTPLQEAELAA